MKNKKVTVIGLGNSGLNAAFLLKDAGADVRVTESSENKDIRNNAKRLEEKEIPFEIGAKYEAKGLKPADAFIAAYVEWTGADILVTENRHFLSRQSSLPFKILSAKSCLSLIKTTLHF